MNTQTQKVELSEEQKMELFSNLLDTPIDQIDTVAGFATFPAGTYVLGGERASADIAKLRITLMFAHNDTLDVSERSTVPPVETGSLFSIMYIDELGIKRFRTQFGKIMEHLGISTLRQFLENHFEGSQFVATVTERPDKKNPDMIYNGLREIILTDMADHDDPEAIPAGVHVDNGT